MQVPATGPARVRVREFEVDLRSGEVRHCGDKIKLQERPFQLLAALLRRPGEVVTREEMQQQLWPANTFVDFEHSINTAVNKLREALGDDAENPRFIETLPRHGYRFIAPVELVEANDSRPEVGKCLVPPKRQGARGKALQKRWVVAAIAGALVAILGTLVGLNVAGLRSRLTAYAWAHNHAPVQVSHIESIAVLPLENLSRIPEEEYFADGLTDTLITDLAKVATLRVISRTSVMRYKGAMKPLPEIARELDVDAVVEGTVQRSGDRVRLTAQLLDARTDRHLWAETYERDSGEIIRLEAQAALSIAHEVSGRLTTAEETRLASKRTSNPQAFDAYLRGRYLWNDRTAEPASGAGAYFEQALRQDPGFALAYSGLADYYSVSWGPWVDLPRAEDYARKAVALEPDLAEGHASLGIAIQYQGRFDDADRELRRAVDLNPNYVMAHHWYALHLLALGRVTEALGENDRARQLDPFSLPVNFLRAGILMSMHEYDRAVGQLETAKLINPGASSVPEALARIYWIEGRGPEALAEERAAANLAHSPGQLRNQDEVEAVYAKAGLRAAQLKDAQVRERACRASLLGSGGPAPA